MSNESDERASKTSPPLGTDAAPSAAGAASDRTKQDPENTIRPTRRRVRAAPVAPSNPMANDRTEPGAVPAGASRAKDDKSTERVVPEHIHRRFVAVGHRYYFPDGAHAFTDRGSRLTTKSENTEVIKSLIAIAQSRGWTEITVSGTERVRKDAWIAANVTGLDVRGYRPSELERAQLARAIAKNHGRVEGGEGTPVDPAASKYAPSSAAAPARDRFISGRLVDHGVAPYRHDPHERMSYFVKLETPTGVREIWGVDLQRALKESLTNPKNGDEVGLRAIRRDAVKVQVAERDENGAVLRENPLETHRNHWIIEKREFFTERAAAARTVRDTSVEPKAGARRHPELVGTYLQMRAAELAAQKFQDPADRATFLTRVRAALADRIARGEPMNPILLRDRPPPAKAAPAPAELTR